MDYQLLSIIVLSIAGIPIIICIVGFICAVFVYIISHLFSAWLNFCVDSIKWVKSLFNDVTGGDKK